MRIPKIKVIILLPFILLTIVILCLCNIGCNNLAIGYTNWRIMYRNKAAIENYCDSIGTKAKEEILLGIWTWDNNIHRSKTQKEPDKYEMALYADKTFTILHKYDTGGFVIKGIHYQVINGKWEKIGRGRIKLHYEGEKIQFDNNIPGNTFTVDLYKTYNIFIHHDRKLKE